MKYTQIKHTDLNVSNIIMGEYAFDTAFINRNREVNPYCT